MFPRITERSRFSHLQAPILRAVMTLLSTYVGPQRDHACFPTIWGHLKTCRCTPAILALPCHSRSPTSGCCIRDDFIARMCHELLASLCPLTPGEFRARTSGMSDEDQPWPNSAQDLFPRHPAGEHEAILGLSHWALYELSVLPVMSAVARFWDPFGRMLVRVPFTFKYPLIHLEYCVKGFKPDDAHALHTFIQATTSVVRFFRDLERIDVNCITACYVKNIKELFSWAVRVDSIADALGGKSVLLSDVRTWCFYMKTSQASQEPQMKRELDLFVASPQGIFTLAFKALREARSRDQCLYIECEHKPNGPTQICSGCGVVHYCSSECQSAAWKDPGAPHQSVCKAIKKLRASLDMTGLEEWNCVFFVRGPGLSVAWDNVRFAEFCTAAGADVENGKTIGDALAATMAKRTKFLNARVEYAPWVQEKHRREKAEEENAKENS
ncbi:hypothetical protein C8F01DRAFT_1225855 [Mycena amicta]|nr:hypothetical protein C8F01DRAFT_1225855 [Mycena amicta]